MDNFSLVPLPLHKVGVTANRDSVGNKLFSKSSGLILRGT